jgi:ornithine cyclodeaminase/alanine dehydrogenase-like protein (mu-crystallin family)
VTARVPALTALTAAETRARLGYRAAVEALEAALRAGADPATDSPRASASFGQGEVLVMPARVGDAVGVKVVTVTPGNASRGLPRVQGVHLVFDPVTLAPTAILDGATLTAVRTPAVSLVGIRPALALRSGALRVVVFGAGPQAIGHVEALQEVVAPIRPLESVTYVARRERPCPPGFPGAELLQAAHHDDVTDRLARADLIVCATTARTPLFDSGTLPDHAVVVAVGSHEPDARELDSALLGRAQVIVEDVATARRESGDVVLAIEDGSLDPQGLLSLRDVVTGRVSVVPGTPVVVKTSGMSWEDAVVGQVALQPANPSHPA